MALEWEDQMRRLRVMENLENNLQALQAQVEGFSDPAKADLNILENYYLQEIMVQKGDTDLTTQEHLSALVKVEIWFTSRGSACPDVVSIANKRAVLQAKLTE